MNNRINITINNHVATVKLNRPEKMNALDEPMFHAIIEAGESIRTNPSLRCVVLVGEGKAFCAGMDTTNFSAKAGTGIFANPLMKRTHGVANIFQKVAWIWRELPVPVIAAVHGAAIGGGLAIMSGADIKFVTPDTKLAIMEFKYGLIPDMAGSQLWRHSVRDDIIRELTYTHRIFSGEDAVRYGFATHLSTTPYEDALKLAEEIASKNPTAVSKAKNLFNQAPYLNEADGLLLESEEQSAVIGKKNQMEAVMAVVEKRAARFD